MTSTPTGKFIVFEGLDGAGTSTQMQRLADWLRERGIFAEVTREPSNGPFGSVIRQAIEGRISLSHRALALAFASDRMDHLENPDNGIEKTLAEGRWVLCDRYVLSSLAYQGALLQDLDWISDLNRHARTPHVTIFIDTATSDCVERIGRRSAHMELFHDEGRLNSVAEWYARAMAKGNHVGKLVAVNGSLTPDRVFEEMIGRIAPWLKEQGVGGATPE